MNGNKVRNSLIILLFLIVIIILIFRGRINTNAVSIVFVGDIMLDRNVKIRIDKIGFDRFFRGVSGLIDDADISVGNLEGPFTTYPSVTTNLKNKELKFTFDPRFTTALSDLGFDILGLANNHTLNFGREGLEMTHRYISSSGMAYYGDPFNKDEISTIVTKNGIKVGLIGFHEFYYTNFDKVFAEIVRLRPLVDILIVTPHWGIEYQKIGSENQKELGHKFIDLGADVVIGTHPHVIENIEYYKGKKIYYSLGNFVFDQYFLEETMEGLAVMMDIEKDKKDRIEIKYKDIKVKIDKEGVRLQ